MRLITLGLAIAFLAVSPHCLSAQDKKLTLFDGKSLNGWKAEGVTKDKNDGSPIWTVRDGMIHCAGKGYGFLRYAEKEFGDFHFHLEYRFVKKSGRNNSGIGIRTVPFDPKKSRDTRPSFACYEIQLLNDAGKKPDTHCTGSLYRYVAPKEIAVKPAPEWNEVDIVCVGPRIRISMNGKEILDFDQTTMKRVKDNPLRGFLCVQNHGSEIEFRNLWVEEHSK